VIVALTILLAMSGDIWHNSTGHEKAAEPFDEIGDTTILQLTRPWEPPLWSTCIATLRPKLLFNEKSLFECG
jgi:hypothetical protein